MKTLIYCFILTVVTQFNWELFTSMEGNFSILSPAKLEEKKQLIPSELGKIEYYTYSCHFEDPKEKNFAYVVSYSDYPKGMIPLDSINIREEFLASSMEAAAENLKGEIVYAQPEIQQDINGLRGRIEYSNGAAVMRTKMFFHQDRFYSIQVFSTSANSLNKDSEKFLGSFRFLE